MQNLEKLKQEILKLTREYSSKAHGNNLPGYESEDRLFVAGENSIPYAARVFDADEVEAAVSSMLDFWLTLGPEGEKFEKALANFLSVKKCLAVNSGSSANLVAFNALTSHKLPEEKRIKKGDEVITVAAGFPTTVAPIVQAGAVPVFLDANPITGNVDLTNLEEAYAPDKTRAVMMAHALGNPFDLKTIVTFCKKYNLWLIEDNCDALGCSYTIPENSWLKAFYPRSPLNGSGSLTKYTGTWGDISTQSFYPPHHLTMGEGGAVNIVSNMKLKLAAESFRDWGRDCWCPSGKDNTCNKRFGWQLGDLPQGYDHKYTYSHLGFNLKPLDPQAAIGYVQVSKLPRFIKARKDNWQHLRAGLDEVNEFMDFALPTHATKWNADGSFEWDETGCKTDCSWFGFKMTIKDDAPFTRTELAHHLENNKIGNRMLFGGNLVRQPAFVNLIKDDPNAFRVVGELKGANRIMNNTIFIGTYPGLTNNMKDYMVDTIVKFVKSF